MKKQEKKSGGGSNGLYERVNVEEQERIVKKFKYTEDIKFGFNDQAVIIDFENHSIIINYDEVQYKYIALFNRFKTNEKIFDDSYSAPKNVPAFKNASAGNSLKYSRTFEQDGKVILNYYIRYNGKMSNEEKYQESINFAIAKINEMVQVDTKMINENYNGDNLILYSAAFEIILGNNMIEAEEKAKYNQYLNTDVEFVKFSFNPNVFEVKKDDWKYIKNNPSKVLYDSCEYINTDIGRYDSKEQRWISEYRFELPRYDLYYNQLRSYFYEGGIYYRNQFKDFYIASDNYALVDGSDMVEYLVNNKEELVQTIYDNSPEIWGYKDIDRECYSIEIDSTGVVVVSFPYTDYYIQYDSGEEVYYNSHTYFRLENNNMSDVDYSRYISISKYYY